MAVKPVLRALGVVAALVAFAAGAGVVAVLRMRHQVTEELPRYEGRTMPAFALADLDGRTWSNADLAGKTVFVNVWATWCAPCRQELPHLQELYDKLTTSNDIVLITLNVDEKPEVVAPFVREHKLTFPVIPAFRLVRGELKVRGIPRNWVLDGAGVWRVDEVGLPATPLTSWVSWAEGLIDEARSPSPG